MAGGIYNNDSQGPLSEINITPFVDVMLVLLIIFMITAPLMEAGIPIQLPKTDAKALPKNEEMATTLYLTHESKIFLDKEEVGYRDLKEKIGNYFKTKTKKEIFIKADGTLPYAFVAQVMASIKNAGIQKIGLVTQPNDEKTSP